MQQHVDLLRESNASREGAELLPTWLIISFLALAFLGAGYLFWNSGGFSVNVFNPARVAWDGAGTGGAAAAPDPMVIGKRLFTPKLRRLSPADRVGRSRSVSSARRERMGARAGLAWR